MGNNLSEWKSGLQIRSAANKMLGGAPGLRVRWFNAWHPELDAALTALPETDECPRELFRLLGANTIGPQKRIALVSCADAPVAIIALRKQGPHWVPITQWMLPGAIFPSAAGYEVPALAALGIAVEIAWWRIDAQPPAHPYIRHLEKTPTHCIPCSADYEQFWRESGKFKDVRKARNQCKDFTVEVDAPGSAEWVIRHWAEKWTSSSDDYMAYLEDRLIAARYLSSKKKFHTLMLMDNGSPVGGETFYVHRNDLVAGYIFRKSEYDHISVGTRLIDIGFNWAAQTAYNNIDIGGGFGYKKGWAPEDGARWKFQVIPPPLFALRQALHKGKRIGARLFMNHHRSENDQTDA